MNPMTMRDWVQALDKMIVSNQRAILEGFGSITHEQAITKAEEEYELYRQRELRNYRSAFDEMWDKLNQDEK
jgi:hypothetical protein